MLHLIVRDSINAPPYSEGTVSMLHLIVRGTVSMLHLIVRDSINAPPHSEGTVSMLHLTVSLAVILS